MSIQPYPSIIYNHSSSYTSIQSTILLLIKPPIHSSIHQSIIHDPLLYGLQRHPYDCFLWARMYMYMFVSFMQVCIAIVVQKVALFRVASSINGHGMYKNTRKLQTSRKKAGMSCMLAETGTIINSCSVQNIFLKFYEIL